MIWSYSTARQFRQCQRQWYFKNIFAHHAARDPKRREAYLLSKLQSIHAWRGRLVDTVISEHIIPAVSRGSLLPIDSYIRTAKNLFEGQVAFARANRMREPGMTQAKAGNLYAAWHPIEYERPVTDELLYSAWSDVEAAVRNFFSLDILAELLKGQVKLIAQRALQFSAFAISVRAVPDLIIFQADGTATIVDWKVHSFGQRDARDQLAIYAVALSRVNPHKDFPTKVPRDIKEISIKEVQLLTRVVRDFSISDEDREDVEDFILLTGNQMALATQMAGDDSSNIADNFNRTEDPRRCVNCAFKRICWS